MNTLNPKILVVDDEPEVVSVLKDFLAIKGYEVQGAISGEEALDILSREKIDLVLLDLKMPGLNGAEIARLIKKKYPDMKVVTLTAYPDMGKSLSDENLLDGVFIKPIRMQELFSRLLRLFKQNKNGLEIQETERARNFLITARLLFVESSLDTYNLLQEHFIKLANKGEHYLIEVASSQSQVREMLKSFNPDILIVNASFLKAQGKDIITDIMKESSIFKEVLIYNIDNVKNCDERMLEKLTKNVELTCLIHSFAA